MKTKAEYYQDFFDVFQESVLDCVSDDILFTLTGGHDTRVIAGILASNNIDLPVICWGSKIETAIAAKIGSILGFSEMYFTSKTFAYDDINGLGYTKILTGLFFDEINSGFSGFKAKSYTEFKQVQKLGLDMRIKQISSQNKVTWICPLMESKVISCLEKIPFQYRVNKQIQRWIIKTKFPKLWNQLYYNSLLPMPFPYSVHNFVTFLHLFKNNTVAKLNYMKIEV